MNVELSERMNVELSDEDLATLRLWKFDQSGPYRALLHRLADKVAGPPDEIIIDETGTYLLEWGDPHGSPTWEIHPLVAGEGIRRDADGFMPKVYRLVLVK